MTITAKALIDAKYASASSTTEYTAPTSTKTIIDKFTVTNTDGSARTFTINVVPSGGVVASSNVLVQTKSIATLETYDVVELKNHVLNTGDAISVLASAVSTLVIRASGREIT